MTASRRSSPRRRTRTRFVFATVSAVSLGQIASTDGTRDVPLSVVVRAGRLVCVDAPSSPYALSYTNKDDEVDVVDLEGGAVSPGLTMYGSALGLEEIHKLTRIVLVALDRRSAFDNSLHIHRAPMIDSPLRGLDCGHPRAYPSSKLGLGGSLRRLHGGRHWHPPTWQVRCTRMKRPG
ncbi:hypothetical protein LXA43DRAFT_479441 [Ganoderma leucocontextum]|nr:hypothetical protein LXA43DRAFT_479441 [Ganoderma leucocontextum]